MTPAEAAQRLADAMNEIEAEGYILYPHPRPVGIAIRVSTGTQLADHPEKTVPVSFIRDEGDGQGWKVKMPR